jgi:hypothetical protein
MLRVSTVLVWAAATVGSAWAKAALTLTEGEAVRVDFYPAWARESNDCFASSCAAERVYNLFLNVAQAEGQPFCDFVKPLGESHSIKRKRREKKKNFFFFHHVSHSTRPPSPQFLPPKSGRKWAATTSISTPKRSSALCSARSV